MAIWVATAAGLSSGLAWLGLVVSILALSIGLGIASWTWVHLAACVLGLLLLLRAGDRLLIAPLYGGGLLLILELARTSMQLRQVETMAPAALWGRLWTLLVLASLGTCAAAVVALATTGAPARSIAGTATGAVAVAALCGGIIWLARRAADAAPDASVSPAGRDEANAGRSKPVGPGPGPR